MNLKMYKWLEEVMKSSSKAITMEREKNKKLGLPNVYSLNGVTFYELPDGTITQERPAILKDSPPLKKTKS